MKNLFRGKVVGATLSTLFLAAIAGCGSDDARRREIAQIEGEEAAKKQVETENRNRDQRAKAMEEDLAQRDNFIDALTGDFVGTYTRIDSIYGEQKWEVHMNLTSSLPTYKPPQRVRSPEEIAVDLAKIAIRPTVKETNLDSGNTFGCDYGDVLPDYNYGMFQAKASSCNKQYFVSLALPDTTDENPIPKDSQIKMARALMSGALLRVDELTVIITSNFDREKRIVQLKRKLPNE